MRTNFDQDILLLEAENPEEASWISELYEGDIDLVILSKNGLLNAEMERARDRMRLRRPQIAFLESGFVNEGSASDLIKLTDTLKKFMQGRQATAINSATANR
jgi:hypothetical protein